MPRFEQLTEDEREDVEALPRMQEGCPDKTCYVCKANSRRTAAQDKLLRIHDTQADVIQRALRALNEDQPAKCYRILIGDE